MLVHSTAEDFFYWGSCEVLRNTRAIPSSDTQSESDSFSVIYITPIAVTQVSSKFATLPTIETRSQDLGTSHRQLDSSPSCESSHLRSCDDGSSLRSSVN